MKLLLAALLLGPQDAVTETVQEKTADETLSREEIAEPIQRGVKYLLGLQNEDGSWANAAPSTFEIGFAHETFYAWQLASQGLACMALASVPPTEETDKALARGIDFLCTTRIPTRGADWDIDGVWTAIYGFTSCIELLSDKRFAEHEGLKTRANEFLGELRRHQALSGGWAYYDDPPFDTVPTWATSFCTAQLLPYLVQAKALGFEVEDRMIARATKYVRQCALPNGAYTYDLTPVPRISGVEHINKVEGSLGRIQVCNWGLSKAGVKQITHDVVREGLEHFFDKHGFLDHVRTRPIPHEGFHANAGYFYFYGHYYAAQAIDLLPEDEREFYHSRLRPHITKTQWDSGGTSDFLGTGYMRVASTSFLVMTLQAGM